MKGRPATRSGYAREDLERVRATCLSVADALGELMNDVTVVGGLAPVLLIPPEKLPAGEQHVGTLDLDLGIGLSGDATVYERISRELSTSGFSLDPEPPGESDLRWVYPSAGEAEVWVDLIPDGVIHGREPWLPQIRFAMEKRHKVRLEGRTLKGKELSTSLWVCDPAVFLLLKAVAFRRRRDRKDAHDLSFVLRYYPGDLMPSVAELNQDSEARALLRVLEDSFCEDDSDGPLAVARFVTGRPDKELQADVAGAVRDLLRRLYII